MKWVDIPFVNYDKPNYTSMQHSSTIYTSSIVSGEMTCPDTKRELNAFIMYPQLFSYTNGNKYIDDLFKSIDDTVYQYKLDFKRHKLIINGFTVGTEEDVYNYIDYAFSNTITHDTCVKRVISCCTQAILSIPMTGIYNNFDLNGYILGEMDPSMDPYDKTMIVDVSIEDKKWDIYITKVLRVFDIYSTLCYVELNMGIDQDGMIISTRPFR
tara:strand:- start:214 stop:849 length:636 start_codon:yes stop_codon:yes gene_type:complete